MGVALLSARWLGPGDRGDLVLATTLATLLLLVSSMGAGGASRVLLAERDRWWTWSRYVRLAGALTVPHVALSASLGLVILSWLATGDAALFVPFVVYSATALPAHLLREGLHGLGRHRTTMAIDVLNATAQLALITAAYQADALTPAVALYIGALCYAGCIAAQIAVGRSADVLAATRPVVSARTWWREAGVFLRISRFALLAALGQSFVVIGDRLVLGAAGSPADVGVYAAASSLAQLTWVAPVALTALLTRRTAEAQSLDVWRRMHRPVLALTAVLAVLVSVLGWFAIPILLGDEFAAARSVLPILCVAAIPYASYHFDSAACVGLRDLRTGGVGALQGCLTLLVATTIGYALLDTPGIAYGVLLTYLGMAVTTRMRMPGGRLHRPGDRPCPCSAPSPRTRGRSRPPGEARVVPVRGVGRADRLAGRTRHLHALGVPPCLGPARAPGDRAGAAARPTATGRDRPPPAAASAARRRRMGCDQRLRLRRTDRRRRPRCSRLRRGGRHLGAGQRRRHDVPPAGPAARQRAARPADGGSRSPGRHRGLERVGGPRPDGRHAPAPPSRRPHRRPGRTGAQGGAAAALAAGGSASCTPRRCSAGTRTRSSPSPPATGTACWRTPR